MGLTTSSLHYSSSLEAKMSESSTNLEKESEVAFFGDRLNNEHMTC